MNWLCHGPAPYLQNHDILDTLGENMAISFTDLAIITVFKIIKILEE